MITVVKFPSLVCNYPRDTWSFIERHKPELGELDIKNIHSHVLEQEEWDYAVENKIFDSKLEIENDWITDVYGDKHIVLYTEDDNSSFDKTLKLLREHGDDMFMFFETPLFSLSSENKIWGEVTPYDVWCDEKNNKKAEGQP